MILAGQPELANRLNEERLRQLKQRVALRCELTALDLQETAAYISTRVRVARRRRRNCCSPATLWLPSMNARGGIPRTVSVICDNALVSGFAADLKPIGRDIIVEVCRDFEFGTPQTLPAVKPAGPQTTGCRLQAPEPVVPASGSFRGPAGPGVALVLDVHARAALLHLLRICLTRLTEHWREQVEPTRKPRNGCSSMPDDVAAATPGSAFRIEAALQPPPVSTSAAAPGR